MLTILTLRLLLSSAVEVSSFQGPMPYTLLAVLRRYCGFAGNMSMHVDKIKAPLQRGLARLGYCFLRWTVVVVPIALDE